MGDNRQTGINNRPMDWGLDETSVFIDEKDYVVGDIFWMM